MSIILAGIITTLTGTEKRENMRLYVDKDGMEVKLALKARNRKEVQEQWGKEFKLTVNDIEIIATPHDVFAESTRIDEYFLFGIIGGCLGLVVFGLIGYLLEAMLIAMPIVYGSMLGAIVGIIIGYSRQREDKYRCRQFNKSSLYD